MSPTLSGYFLGRRPYRPIFELMMRAHEARKNGSIGDVVLLLEHDPVITLGSGAKKSHLLANDETLAKLGIDVVETRRGGDVTLHAPGQLVAYPILDLNPDKRDVRKYVAALTDVMRQLVSAHGIGAGTREGMIGLWADRQHPFLWPGEQAASQPEKLGAVGVRISRWVTAHGFALNLATDLSLFSLIVPCGIQDFGVSSVHEMVGATPDLHTEAKRALSIFGEVFQRPVSALVDLSAAPTERIDSRLGIDES